MASVFEKAKQEGQEQPEMAEAQDSGFGEEGGDSGQSPEYLQARELMLSKLYEEGAAEGIARSLASAPSIVQGIVDQSMALVDVMEEATQGSVPDEEAMAFVIDIVQEVIEIAKASGTNVRNADIAAAVGEVLAQVVENLGGDSRAIRAEMATIDPEEIGAQLEAEEA